MPAFLVQACCVWLTLHLATRCCYAAAVTQRDRVGILKLAESGPRLHTATLWHLETMYCGRTREIQTLGAHRGQRRQTVSAAVDGGQLLFSTTQGRATMTGLFSSRVEPSLLDWSKTVDKQQNFAVSTAMFGCSHAAGTDASLATCKGSPIDVVFLSKRSETTDGTRGLLVRSWACFASMSPFGVVTWWTPASRTC